MSVAELASTSIKTAHNREWLIQQLVASKFPYRLPCRRSGHDLNHNFYFPCAILFLAPWDCSMPQNATADQRGSPRNARAVAPQMDRSCRHSDAVSFRVTARPRSLADLYLLQSITWSEIALVHEADTLAFYRPLRSPERFSYFTVAHSRGVELL